jgi:hypothetical protein
LPRSRPLVHTPLTDLPPDGYGGFAPSPATTAADQSPGFDSYIVIWQSAGWDFFTATKDDINHVGGLTWNQGIGPTFSEIAFSMLRADDRNVFKHEWGHAILFYFEAAGKSPRPTIDNHHPETSVNCRTGRGYVQVDDNDTNPVSNSIYNDDAGFTHDYYSGQVATSDVPTRCLRLGGAVWASGGPVTRGVGAPMAVSVSGNDTTKSATIKWSAPAVTGGAPITGYRVSRDGTDANGTGAWSATVSAAARSQTFTSLRPGDTYTLTVQAITGSVVGPSAAGSVTMTALPGMATIGTATPGVSTDSVVSITADWKPPTTGGPVSSFQLTAVNSATGARKSVTAPSTARSLPITALAAGKSYSVEVVALNAAGAGPTSARSNAVVAR